MKYGTAGGVRHRFQQATEKNRSEDGAENGACEPPVLARLTGEPCETPLQKRGRRRLQRESARRRTRPRDETRGRTALPRERAGSNYPAFAHA
jgi:hypothetical protein